jgi:hypothetical protein
MELLHTNKKVNVHIQTLNWLKRVKFKLINQNQTKKMAFYSFVCNCKHESNQLILKYCHAA